MHVDVFVAGDRLLAINDVTLVGFTHKQAVEALHNAPMTSRLTIVRGAPPTHVAPDPTSPVHSRSLSPTPVPTPSLDSHLVSHSAPTDVDATTATNAMTEDDADQSDVATRDDVFGFVTNG